MSFQTLHLHLGPNYSLIWSKIFKNWPSKVCGRQPLKNLKWYGLSDEWYFSLYILWKFCSTFLEISMVSWTAFFSFFFNKHNLLTQSFHFGVNIFFMKFGFKLLIILNISVAKILNLFTYLHCRFSTLFQKSLIVTDTAIEILS